MQVYLAGPLFSESERGWLKTLIQQIEALGFDVYWSWERHRGRSDSPEGIFETCKDGLDSSDAMLAILDGPQVDDGTAWEIGYFYARGQRGKPIVGLRTDLRRAGELDASIVNAMIQGACDHVARDTADALSALAQRLNAGKAAVGHP